MSLLAQVPPPSGGSGWLVLIVVALLTGSGGATVVAIWRQRRLGAAERESIISSAAQQAVSAAKEIIEQYRRDLSDLRERLAVADDRIARLEADLRETDKDRHRLERELARAIDRRDAINEDYSALKRRVADLETRVPPTP